MPVTEKTADELRAAGYRGDLDRKALEASFRDAHDRAQKVFWVAPQADERNGWVPFTSSDHPGPMELSAFRAGPPVLDVEEALALEKLTRLRAAADASPVEGAR